MTTIVPIPCLQDNYTWLIRGETSLACLIDPGEAKPVIQYLHTAGYQPAAILITHDHADHISGILDICMAFPDVDIPVMGPGQAKISGLTTVVEGGTLIELPGFAAIEVYDIPGHTAQHLAYRYDGKHVFCGDTLFSMGCGRVLQGGNIQALFRSLQQLANLEADTWLYPAHEYTLKNLSFALAIEPNNPQLQAQYRRVQALRAAGQPSLPTPLSTEKACNPFLRTQDVAIQRYVAQQTGCDSNDAMTIFTHLRQLKDQY